MNGRRVSWREETSKGRKIMYRINWWALTTALEFNIHVANWETTLSGKCVQLLCRWCGAADAVFWSPSVKCVQRDATKILRLIAGKKKKTMKKTKQVKLLKFKIIVGTSWMFLWSLNEIRTSDFFSPLLSQWEVFIFWISCFHYLLLQKSYKLVVAFKTRRNHHSR